MTRLYKKIKDQFLPGKDSHMEAQQEPEKTVPKVQGCRDRV